MFCEDTAAPRRCRPCSSASASGSSSALINIVGVEFLINYGGLGQLINELRRALRPARQPMPRSASSYLTSVLFFIVTERIERWLRPQT